MIRSVLITAVVLVAVPHRAWAEEAEPPKAEGAPEEEPIEHYRTPIEVLNERMIGAASKSVRFDWRRSNVAVGIIGSELLERNNFGSTRLGGFVRKPFGDFMGELGITRAFTWGTDSTNKLALTPYRQFARPSRFELDLNLSYPLAEGVVTAWPGFFPATEVVFSGSAGLRYLFYPGSVEGAKFGEAARTLVQPRLSQRELTNLEEDRLGGMQIDDARYGLLAGATMDVYFQSGGFLSPRVLVALPILSPVEGTGLGFWWELTLGLGWAF